MKELKDLKNKLKSIRTSNLKIALMEEQQRDKDVSM